jgi:hypothetical protein
MINGIIFIDIRTLNLFLVNFGIISTKRNPTQSICLDDPSTSKHINVYFCGAPINLYCLNYMKDLKLYINKKELL